MMYFFLVTPSTLPYTLYIVILLLLLLLLYTSYGDFCVSSFDFRFSFAVCFSSSWLANSIYLQYTIFHLLCSLFVLTTHSLQLCLICEFKNVRAFPVYLFFSLTILLWHTDCDVALDGWVGVASLSHCWQRVIRTLCHWRMKPHFWHPSSCSCKLYSSIWQQLFFIR